jgi:hypothetical protein
LEQKYAQFLKETGSKMEDYKGKVKDLEGKIQVLAAQNKDVGGQLKNKEDENTKLLQMLQSNLDK